MRRFGHGAVLAVAASRINPESHVDGRNRRSTRRFEWTRGPGAILPKPE